jgi:LysR family transcriptional regulator, cyn operon transcriptional activator
MTFQQLTYILAAIEHGTLSRAAESLDVSQSNLSEQIIRLEEAVGAALFVRTNRQLRLTEAGRELEPHARTCLAAARHGQEAVQAFRTMSGGVVSFGTFGTAHDYFLHDLIAEFLRRHPEMRVLIVGQNSSEVAQAVSEGRLEAGLIMLPVDERNLQIGEPVWSTRVGYVSADPARLDGAKGIRDLADAPLIMTEARWSRNDPVRHQLNLRAQEAGVTLLPRIEVENKKTAFELTKQGVGDMISTRPTLKHLGYDDCLGWVPIEPPIHEVFAFIQHREATLSPATRALKRMMRDHLDALQSRYGDLED